jgi:hypothetical protein
VSSPINLFLWVAVTLFLGLASLARAESQHFLVQCVKPCEGVIAAVDALGGDITYEYENIGAVAVAVQGDRRSELLALAGVDAVYKDSIVHSPEPLTQLEIETAPTGTGADHDALHDALAILPEGYLNDLRLNGASTLHQAGIDGAGVLVAVIDTGTANNPTSVPSLAGRVIGGENFVALPGEPSATSTENDPHGTWVGSTIAGSIGFLVPTGSTFAQSVLNHAPDSAIPEFMPGATLIPMVGTAPAADIYAIKIFSAFGGGAPTSRIVAAMDRVITIRENFNKGEPFVPVSGAGTENDPFAFDSAPIDIVNMSLGGPTFFAEGNLADQLTRAMLKVGITLVVSAGNGGPAAMTGGSPGTGKGSLTTGAASVTANERILRDLRFGLGAGSLYRPAGHQQMAADSARGPTAAGRMDPDVSASGFAVLAQGTNGAPVLVSGTSFAAANVAGGAALLRQSAPWASAEEIRDALIRSADPHVVEGAEDIDQGEGFADFSAARACLLAGGNGDDDGWYRLRYPVTWRSHFGFAGECLGRRYHVFRYAGRHSKLGDAPSHNVRENIARLGFRTVKFREGVFSTHIPDLLPGQVAHFFIRSRKDTDLLRITLDNVVPELASDQQNPWFSDEIFVTVVDAPTSFAVRRAEGFVGAPGPATVEVPNPQTGIVRVAVVGAWTNAGRIAADLIIEEERSPQGGPSAKGKVAQGDTAAIQVDVAPGTAEAVFELSWKENWGHYPTDDLDLVLIDPSGVADETGVTFASPERVVLSDPLPGIWTLLVSGLTVHEEVRRRRGAHDGDAQSRWELRVTADGTRLQALSENEPDSLSEDDDSECEEDRSEDDEDWRRSDSVMRASLGT